MIASDRINTQTSEMPLVCVCVPTYNAAKTIRESLVSIISQSYLNLTIHISDNASTDDTLDVIELVTDSRILVHRQEVNIGAEGNFTECIKIATGKYTAIYHADDLYDSSMVAKQVAYLEANLDVGAVFTEAITIDENGVPFGVIGAVPDGVAGNIRIGFCELLKTILLHHNFLVCPSVMVRTEIYRDQIKVWGDSSFRSASDVDTWLRLAKLHPIAVLNEKLMQYRISKTQYSNSNRNRTERADFFLVIDHYLSKPDVRNLLTSSDLRHYRWLDRHDRTARAFNLFILGRISDAKPLLSGFLSFDAIYSAILSRRGLVTLSGALILRLLMLFGASKASEAIVRSVKRISWR